MTLFGVSDFTLSWFQNQATDVDNCLHHFNEKSMVCHVCCKNAKSQKVKYPCDSFREVFPRFPFFPVGFLYDLWTCMNIYIYIYLYVCVPPLLSCMGLPRETANDLNHVVCASCELSEFQLLSSKATASLARRFPSWSRRLCEKALVYTSKSRVLLRHLMTSLRWPT